MARTQSADYPLRREAIVEAAAELIAARGFLGASMADLGQACGASKSLLYHYFPAKEDILYEIMMSHLAVLEEAADSLPAGGAPAERLRALLAAWMARYAGARARHVVLLNGLDFLPPDRRSEVVHRQRALVARLERLLTAIRPALAQDRARLRATAMLAFGMINWTHTWYDPAGPVDPQALAALASDLLLNGLASA